MDRQYMRISAWQQVTITEWQWKLSNSIIQKMVVISKMFAIIQSEKAIATKVVDQILEQNLPYLVKVQGRFCYVSDKSDK